MAHAFPPIGHNNPPSPLDVAKEAAADLAIEAAHWLDGSKVVTQAEADEVQRLIRVAQAAWKDADAGRIAEKRPHDDAAAAVQKAWKPTLDRIARIVDVAKPALAEFLNAEERRQRAEAAEARRIAEEAHEATVAAFGAAPAGDLAARNTAEAALERSRIAEAEAARAEGAKPLAKGLGRAIGLRSRWVASVTDRREAMGHYYRHREAEVDAWLATMAQRDVNAGARSIPGVSIVEERVT